MRPENDRNAGKNPSRFVGHYLGSEIDESCKFYNPELELADSVSRMNDLIRTRNQNHLFNKRGQDVFRSSQSLQTFPRTTTPKSKYLLLHQYSEINHESKRPNHLDIQNERCFQDPISKSFYEYELLNDSVQKFPEFPTDRENNFGTPVHRMSTIKKLDDLSSFSNDFHELEINCHSPQRTDNNIRPIPESSREKPIEKFFGRKKLLEESPKRLPSRIQKRNVAQKSLFHLGSPINLRCDLSDQNKFGDQIFYSGWKSHRDLKPKSKIDYNSSERKVYSSKSPSQFPKKSRVWSSTKDLLSQAKRLLKAKKAHSKVKEQKSQSLKRSQPLNSVDKNELLQRKTPPLIAEKVLRQELDKIHQKIDRISSFIEQINPNSKEGEEIQREARSKKKRSLEMSQKVKSDKGRFELFPRKDNKSQNQICRSQGRRNLAQDLVCSGSKIQGYKSSDWSSSVPVLNSNSHFFGQISKRASWSAKKSSKILPKNRPFPSKEEPVEEAFKAVGAEKVFQPPKTLYLDRETYILSRKKSHTQLKLNKPIPRRLHQSPKREEPQTLLTNPKPRTERTARRGSQHGRELFHQPSFELPVRERALSEEPHLTNQSSLQNPLQSSQQTPLQNLQPPLYPALEERALYPPSLDMCWVRGRLKAVRRYRQIKQSIRNR